MLKTNFFSICAPKSDKSIQNIYIPYFSSQKYDNRMEYIQHFVFCYFGSL